MIINRGDLLFTFYDISTDEASEQQTIDVVKEIKANGNAGFAPYNGDQVTDVRLIGYQQVLRVTY